MTRAIPFLQKQILANSLNQINITIAIITLPAGGDVLYLNIKGIYKQYFFQSFFEYAIESEPVVVLQELVPLRRYSHKIHYPPRPIGIGFHHAHSHTISYTGKRAG